jgi:hypothetical protein
MLLICSSLKKTVDYLLGMDVKYLGEFNAIFGTALGYMKQGRDLLYRVILMKKVWQSSSGKTAELWNTYQDLYKGLLFDQEGLTLISGNT